MKCKWMAGCWCLVAAALILSSAACAKKQVMTQEVAESQVAPVKDAAAEEEAARKAEAQRQAALLRDEVLKFQDAKIYFAFDRADLQPEAVAVLKQKAEWLAAHPAFKVLIEGNCDERGTFEYNLALGERRAAAAQGYLIDLGITPDRISTVSYGEERPADPGQDEAAWAKNRRDEFKVMP